MESLVIAALFGGLYALSRAKDERLFRHGVFLLAMIWFGITGILTLIAEEVPSFAVAVMLMLLLTPLAVVVLAGFLIVNGVMVIGAEGLSLATASSLLAGVVLLVLPMVTVLLVLTTHAYAIGLAALLFFVCSYLGVTFVVFLFSSRVYGRMTHDVRPAALVVLGSRIIDDQVPPLLQSRLDKALEIYAETRLTGPAPLLIPSGGQGEEESRSEGAAMAEYLLAQGADPADVRPEIRATNTRENLVLSRIVQEESGREGPVLAVTNNYHALRAAILARRIGSDAQVVGSPTARYDVPSAFLREFAAVVVEQRRVHLLLVLPFLVLTALAVVALYAVR